MTPATAAYFARFGFCPRQIAEPPHPDLGLAVVVPCYDEPALSDSLDSLGRCQRPACAVEIIVVVNSSVRSDPLVRLQNECSLEDALRWSQQNSNDRFRLHVLFFPDLPAKHAGVGLARKIGMDEALRRLDEVGHLEGVIASFDADCLCDSNYLASLNNHFRTYPRTPGCSVYFEHPLSGGLDRGIYEGAAAYELHLRYYVQALRYAGFPHAFHTVGSAMAVRASAYRAQGGMNRRQAGEDFYFLQKIISLGNFTELNETRVIPSPRPSHRVPFGTGRAVRSYLDRGNLETYPLQAFVDLKMFLDPWPLVQSQQSVSPPGSVKSFLETQDFARALEDIRRHTASPASLQKRFFHWFNPFRVMKYLHHARDHFYGPAQVLTEADTLRKMLTGAADADPGSAEALLRFYRVRDRAG